MAIVEVVITVRLEPDGSGPGIADDAETLADECFYTRASTVEDALVGAEDALNEAAAACELRAMRAWDERYRAPQ